MSSCAALFIIFHDLNREWGLSWSELELPSRSAMKANHLMKRLTKDRFSLVVVLHLLACPCAVIGCESFLNRKPIGCFIGVLPGVSLVRAKIVATNAQDFNFICLGCFKLKDTGKISCPLPKRPINGQSIEWNCNQHPHVAPGWVPK